MRRVLILLAVVLGLPLAGCGPKVTLEERAEAVTAFATVQQVFQHPRCQNCHIPGDAPLQYDAGLTHSMEVTRGPEGHGVEGLPCSTCHGNANSPASFGPNAPPGAPHWGLPPPEEKKSVCTSPAVAVIHWRASGPASIGSRSHRGAVDHE